MADGQRVRHVRLIMPPTLLHSAWNNHDEPVSIEQWGEIVDIRESESGALVTIRIDGGNDRTVCLNSYGQECGGFGMVHVEREAPEQRSLLREVVP
jgi:hypothetical protein